MTNGIHSYSQPQSEYAVFAVDWRCFDQWAAIRLHLSRSDIDVIPLIGSYTNRVTGSIETEHSWSVPVEVYHMLLRKYPFLAWHQESWLHLGRPQARGWLPAKLVFFDGRPEQDLGMFIETTSADARLKDHTYHLRTGRYYICEIDPPANDWERQQRMTADYIKHLEDKLDVGKKRDRLEQKIRLGLDYNHIMHTNG